MKYAMEAKGRRNPSIYLDAAQFFIPTTTDVHSLKIPPPPFSSSRKREFATKKKSPI
jgi:hypothetical protein